MSINDKPSYVSRHDCDSQRTAIISTSPVLLALSTFKHSNRAIGIALEKANQCKKLVIVYGHNVNLVMYFMESEVGLYSDLKEQYEKEILADYEEQWKEKVEVIADRARTQDVQVVTYVHTEHFISLCLKIIEKEKPSLVIMARSHRPDWLRRIFGSVADRLASKVDCSVIEA